MSRFIRWMGYKPNGFKELSREQREAMAEKIMARYERVRPTTTTTEA